jgi:hypothetical protein
VVGLFRRAWKRQQTSAIFCDDEVPEAIGSAGEGLVRVYMQRVAPKIWPAAIHQPLHGVIGAVRIRAELDLIDVEGTVIDIRTSETTCMGQMYRFQRCMNVWPEICVNGRVGRFLWVPERFG